MNNNAPSPDPRRWSIGLPTSLLVVAMITSAAGLLGLSSLSEDGPAAVVPAYRAVPSGGAADPPLPRAAPEIGLDVDTEIASHDGSIVVGLVGGRLEFVDGRTGEVEYSVDVEPGAELRAVSTDGSTAALFRHASGRTEIAVVVAGSPAPPRTWGFDGLIEPEAFSTDGDVLFVIDHQSAAELGAYRVRPLDLGSGRLGTTLGPTKLPITEEMNGLGRRQVWSSDGTRLYTLYIRQTHRHHEPGDRAGSPDDEAAGGDRPLRLPGTDGFVHVLDLVEEWAYCLDLPEDFGHGELDTTALAVSPAGDELAVLDLDAGRVALASTEQLAVTQVLDLPVDLDPAGEVHLGLFPDHLAIAWQDQLRWLGRPALDEVGRETLAGPLLGLTSFDSTLLAWPEEPAAAPRELHPPPLVGGED